MLSVGNKEIHIFGENIEQTALDQFESAMQQPYSVKGSVMPDGHPGYTLNIGGVVATEGAIVPSWVGFDIGCGVAALLTTFTLEDIKINSEKIFNSILRSVPIGQNHNSFPVTWETDLEMTPVIRELFVARKALYQLGTMGSNNHFIEIGFDEQSRIWIIVHSGSRGFGHDVAGHYMALAANSDKPLEGHFHFDENSINGKDYIQDLNFCLAFALENRKTMLMRVLREIQHYCTGEGTWDSLINRNHNHAEKNKEGLWIHRKGATHAELDMLGVIPGNRLDGSFIVSGLGNADSLCSSSHGAGRTGSRKSTHGNNVEEYVEQMKGIVARVGADTIEEAPGAYKNIFEVMSMQSELVTVLHHVKPLINIKAPKIDRYRKNKKVATP